MESDGAYHSGTGRNRTLIKPTRYGTGIRYPGKRLHQPKALKKAAWGFLAMEGKTPTFRQ